eukprot:5199214-Pyramimonas_sp.AAC.1
MEVGIWPFLHWRAIVAEGAAPASRGSQVPFANVPVLVLCSVRDAAGQFPSLVFRAQLLSSLV